MLQLVTSQPRHDAQHLLAHWQEARARGLNNRAVAAELGVSEAQLIASACGRFATRLRLELPRVLGRLPELREIKAVVRTPEAVLERAGIVHDVGVDGAGQASLRADRFELRGDLGAWHSAFALEERSTQSVKLSLQFFTGEGLSATKFFLRPGGDVTAFRSLVRSLAHPDQSAIERVAPRTTLAYAPLQALTPTPADALLRFLDAAQSAALPLTFLVRSPGATLSAAKIIERVKRSERGEWLNVLDDGLDLHLHEARIKYVRLHSDAGPDAGWVHWFSDQRRVALSVHCQAGWNGLMDTCVPGD